MPKAAEVKKYVNTAITHTVMSRPMKENDMRRSRNDDSLFSESMAESRAL